MTSVAAGLRDFYERPGVPLNSGADRARRQAQMLAEVLRTAPQPALIIDMGCGDGLSASVAVQASPATGSSVSTGRRTRSGRLKGAA